MDKNLEKRIEALEKWQKEKDLQQIKYPLDARSVQVLNQYFLSRGDSFVFTNTSGTEFRYILVNQNGVTDAVSTISSLIEFSADASNDTLTLRKDIVNNNTDITISNDQMVYLWTTGTMPSGLTPGTVYYTVNASGNTTQVSLSLGGAAATFTTNGTGTLYLEPLG